MSFLLGNAWNHSNNTVVLVTLSGKVLLFPSPDKILSSPVHPETRLTAAEQDGGMDLDLMFLPEKAKSSLSSSQPTS